MFEGLETFNITTQSVPLVVIHGLRSPSLGPPTGPAPPPLLLLHGFPQTHHIWHRVSAQLAGKFTLVIPDLRGYGASSKPPGVSSYAKSAMARDLTALMGTLGHASFFVCGHDRGARVAHKLAVDRPDLVRALLLLDICPTLAMYEAVDDRFARRYWHWFALIQDPPLPELMLSADPRRLAELLMCGRPLGGRVVFDPECWEAYCRGMEDGEAVHAMCNDYRAAATVDMDEAREDLELGRRIKCPVRTLWAKRGIIEQCFDGVGEWRKITDEGVPVDGHAVESGHYIPEEAPDEVVKSILELFVYSRHSADAAPAKSQLSPIASSTNDGMVW